MLDDPDVQLMLAFQRGDEESFVTLYRKYRDRVFNFCRRMLHSQALSEEAAQEVFLKLYGVRDRYRPQSRMSTYIYRIAVNHCINLRQRRDFNLSSGVVDVERQASPGGAGPESETAREELRSSLKQALAALPGQQAAALMLCHYEGFSYREAAEALATSESAVKSLIHRARAELVGTLAEHHASSMEVRHAVP